MTNDSTKKRLGVDPNIVQLGTIHAQKAIGASMTNSKKKEYVNFNGSEIELLTGTKQLKTVKDFNIINPFINLQYKTIEAPINNGNFYNDERIDNKLTLIHSSVEKKEGEVPNTNQTIMDLTEAYTSLMAAAEKVKTALDLILVSAIAADDRDIVLATTVAHAGLLFGHTKAAGLTNVVMNQNITNIYKSLNLFKYYDNSNKFIYKRLFGLSDKNSLFIPLSIDDNGNELTSTGAISSRLVAQTSFTEMCNQVVMAEATKYKVLQKLLADPTAMNIVNTKPTGRNIIHNEGLLNFNIRKENNISNELGKIAENDTIKTALSDIFKM